MLALFGKENAPRTNRNNQTTRLNETDRLNEWMDAQMNENEVTSSSGEGIQVDVVKMVKP